MRDVKHIKVDNSQCNDCRACSLACSLWHEGECNLYLSRVRIIKDMERYKFNILICEHCESADCMAACPTEALVMDDHGIIVLNDEECTKCGACVEACPYNGIFFNEIINKYFKCDMCAGRAEGPLCTTLCPTGALILVNAQ